MLTDFPLHVIAALGKTVSVHRINKYTREEALWSRCFRLWRRSPIWLLVRVTLQLHFTRQGPIPSATDALYEIFMIQLLFLLLSYARSYLQTSGDGHIYVTNAKMLRRLRKAETLSQLSDVKPSWIDSIRACMTDASVHMDKKWELKVQEISSNQSTHSQASKMTPCHKTYTRPMNSDFSAWPQWRAGSKPSSDLDRVSRKQSIGMSATR